jgi:N-formylglutamate deformylase
MFDEPVSAAKQSRKVMAGYGLLPRLTGARSLIHDHLLPAEEIQQRIALAYRPYHSQLKQLLDNAREQHRRYLLVDCHSMPAADHQGKRLPDVILGDCHGRTLAPDIGKALDDHIRSLGFSLGWNNPYSGGFITSHYGASKGSGQSLQIEINRALYMRDPHKLDKNGTARVSALLTAILIFLDTLIS